MPHYIEGMSCKTLPLHSRVFRGIRGNMEGTKEREEGGGKDPWSGAVGDSLQLLEGGGDQRNTWREKEGGNILKMNKIVKT